MTLSSLQFYKDFQIINNAHLCKSLNFILMLSEVDMDFLKYSQTLWYTESVIGTYMIITYL